MNEAFERSSRVSSLTCIFHVLLPGAAESLRHLGWEPMVKPRQWLRSPHPQWAGAATAAGAAAMGRGLQGNLVGRKGTFTQGGQVQQPRSRKTVGGAREEVKEGLRVLGFETFCLD